LKFDPSDRTAPSRWYAEPKVTGHVDTEAVNKEITSRSTVSPADSDAVLDCLSSILPEKLAEGQTVYLKGVGTFRLSLSSEGVVNPEDFHHNNIKGNHIIFTPDVRILHALEYVPYEDSGAIEITWLEDLLSGTVNSTLSKGASVKHTGNKMKIFCTDPSVGLKLLNLETQQPTLIPLNTIPVNKSSELLFTVPATLVAGSYQVRLITQFSGSKTPLKSPRTFTYEPVLTVV
jgi:predicted histone-like DNA-binding protein